MDCSVVLRGRLPAADLADYLAVVDRFCPDADRRTNSPTLPETGANRTDKAVIVALRGLLGQDPAKLVSARDALSDVRDSGRNSLFRYTSSGDGFYEDGSFVQHDVVAYTGSYGIVLLSGTAYLLALLAGSEWAVADPKVSVMYDAVERTFAPVIFDGLMMDSVRGRAISRERAGDHRDGATALAAILLLASGAPAEYATRWRALVKGWLTRNRTTPSRVSRRCPSSHWPRPYWTTGPYRPDRAPRAAMSSRTWTVSCTAAPAGPARCRSRRSGSRRTRQATARICTAGTPATA